MERSRRDHFMHVLMCWGGTCVCFLLMLCLVPLLFSDVCEDVSASFTPMGVLCHPKCLVFDCNSDIYFSPSGKPFPLHWGEPPAAGTMDLQELSMGFGQGSSTLATWIDESLEADAEHGIHYSPNGKVYPRAWGAPPKFETEDLVPLPGGFGMGSSTLKIWIKMNMYHGVTHYYSPNGKTYPTSWGAPPTAETKDLVVLPGGYGLGSSTLEGWIQMNMDKRSGFFSR